MIRFLIIYDRLKNREIENELLKELIKEFIIQRINNHFLKQTNNNKFSNCCCFSFLKSLVNAIR